MQKNNPMDKNPMSKTQDKSHNPSAENKKKDQAQNKKSTPEQF